MPDDEEKITRAALVFGEWRSAPMSDISSPTTFSATPPQDVVFELPFDKAEMIANNFLGGGVHGEVHVSFKVIPASPKIIGFSPMDQAFICISPSAEQKTFNKDTEFIRMLLDMIYDLTVEGNSPDVDELDAIKLICKKRGGLDAFLKKLDQE